MCCSAARRRGARFVRFVRFVHVLFLVQFGRRCWDRRRVRRGLRYSIPAVYHSTRRRRGGVGCVLFAFQFGRRRWGRPVVRGSPSAIQREARKSLNILLVFTRPRTGSQHPGSGSNKLKLNWELPLGVSSCSSVGRGFVCFVFNVHPRRRVVRGTARKQPGGSLPNVGRAHTRPPRSGTRAARTTTPRRCHSGPA